MLQARTRGQTGWYRPDRDFLVVLPKLAKRAIEIITERYKDDDASIEQLGLLAKTLGRTIEASKNKELTSEQLEEQLLAVGDAAVERSFLYAEFSALFFRLAVQTFRLWELEKIPENADGTVDTERLEKQNEAAAAKAIVES